MRHPAAPWRSLLSVSSGSLDLRSWFAGQLTRKRHSSSMSMTGSKKGRCLRSSTSGEQRSHFRAKRPSALLYLPVSIPRK